MPRVEFQPANKTAEVAEGTPLVAAARQAGLEIETPCGGDGVCRQCLVRVHGEVVSDSAGRLPQTALERGYLLACVTRVASSSVVVELPAAAQARAEAEDEHSRQLWELAPQPDAIEPLARRQLVQVAAPESRPDDCDLERLRAALREIGADDAVHCSLSALRSLASALRAARGEVTLTLHDGHLLHVEPGRHSLERLFGLAVDLGTTTVAVKLIDMTRMQVLATATDYNAQIACGEDVISRINHALRPGGLEELRQRVLGTVDQLLAEVTLQQGINPYEIFNVAVAGNTVMTHLLLGLNPEQIRLAPYTPTVLSPPVQRAADVGIQVHPEGRLHISPCVGSYLGGDITAGLLCTDLRGHSSQLGLFVDIGTNGELVIGNDEFLVGCACSAGPAFEGRGTSCGMRATAGAIERVRVDPATAETRCSVIGEVAPIGICGSGLIELLAQLFVTGWIDGRGNLDRDRRSPRVETSGRRGRFTIVPAQQSGTGQAITIHENEIQNVLRAKAAVYSATALLLRQIGVDVADLSEVVIAGGFGRHLDLDAAITIGLLPDLPRDRFRFLGNTSLWGAALCACSRGFVEQQSRLAERLTYVELSTDPAYMSEYTGALFLPHTDAERFASVMSRKQP